MPELEALHVHRVWVYNIVELTKKLIRQFWKEIAQV